MTEQNREERGGTLGKSKHARTHALIERYKKSHYGDQFNNSMHTIFEEIIKRIEMRKWLDCDEEKFIPLNEKNEERLFSWISKEEINEVDDNGNVSGSKMIEPIITKSNEIRELSVFIHDEKALKHFEESRSVTEGFAHSDAFGESKLKNALERLNENIRIAFNFSEHMKDEDVKDIENLRDKIDRLIPTSRADILNGAFKSAVIPGTRARHFSEVTVSCFRRLKNVTLKKLNRINIFAGYNNTGKSSVLEAVYLLTKLNDINAFFEMEKYRGKFVDALNSKWLESNFLDPMEIEAIFNGKNTKISIVSGNTKEEIDKSGYLSTFELTAQYDDIERTCKAHMYSNKESRIFYEEAAILCNSIVTSPYRNNDKDLKIAHAKAVKDKTVDIIIEFIRKNIDPTIKKIEMTTIDGVGRFFVTSDDFDKSVDLTNYGEGVQRVFEIALFFAYAENGVVLIDEFESAIHKSLLINFSRFVQELAEKFNVQVFLTSHSKECIDSFIENNYKTGDITAYVMKEDGENISCKYVEGKRLAKLLESIDADIREG